MQPRAARQDHASRVTRARFSNLRPALRACCLLVMFVSADLMAAEACLGFVTDTPAPRVYLIAGIALFSFFGLLALFLSRRGD
jgi:hypothetical protein